MTGVGDGVADGAGVSDDHGTIAVVAEPRAEGVGDSGGAVVAGLVAGAPADAVQPATRIATDPITSRQRFIAPTSSYTEAETGGGSGR
jgi:hypothetical protein